MLLSDTLVVDVGCCGGFVSGVVDAAVGAGDGWWEVEESRGSKGKKSGTRGRKGWLPRATCLSVVERIIGHRLALRVIETVVTVLLLVLDIVVSAEDGTSNVGLGGEFVAGELEVGSVVVGTGAGGCCVGGFLRTLGRSGVGVFRLVGAAFALGGRGGGFGGGRVVGTVAVEVGVGWSGTLLGASFFGSLGGGCHFGVGISAFDIGRFGLDGFAALLGSGLFGGDFVVVFGVSVGASFAFGFLGAGTVGGVGDACATHELLLDGAEAGAG